MRAALHQPLAFVDLETTGANAALDRITEIGIVTVVDGVRSEWSQLVNPEAPISDFIAQLTGITDAMVADAPRFAEIADEVWARLEGHLFLAHNARFDFGFLKREFERVGRTFRAPVACTVKLSRKLYPQHHKHNLDTLISRHSLEVASRHRALADARAIADFWTVLTREHTPEALTDAVAELLHPPGIPPHLNAQEIDQLPETPGAFVLYGEAGQPLLVGQNSNLKKKLQALFAADWKASRGARLLERIRRLDTYPCEGELGALLREVQLLNTHTPELQRPAPAGRQPCVWQLSGPPGSHRLSLCLADDIDANIVAPLYGFFASPREARRRLKELLTLNGLCPAHTGLEDSTGVGKPCSARGSRQCKGVCTGHETPLAHDLRLVSVLAKHKLAEWPFSGPAILSEGETVHLVDRWRHVGSARTPEALTNLLTQPLPALDSAVYALLQRHRDRLRPLPPNNVNTMERGGLG